MTIPDSGWVQTAYLFCDRLGIKRKADALHICEGITRAISAAEQRGREMERESRFSEKICTHCGGQGWLTRSPYGDILPCSECCGKGAIRSRTTEPAS